MFSWLKNIVSKKNTKSSNLHKLTVNTNDICISKSVDKNINALKCYMNNSPDIIDRKIRAFDSKVDAGIVFIQNLVDINMVEEYIIKPLITNPVRVLSTQNLTIEAIKNSMLYGSVIEEANTIFEISLEILNGKTFLCIEGLDTGLLIDTVSLPKRNVEEPRTESTVKGPNEGFVENMKDNLGLIRKRLKTPDLCIEFIKTGKTVHNNVAVLYLKGKVKNQILQEVKNRIDSVKGYDIVHIEQLANLISDRVFTIFPLIQWTERPDKAVSFILEGNVGILYDNSRGMLLAPTTISALMQSPDDYYEHWLFGTVITFIRYISLFISTFFPAIYIALTSFHPEMLPTSLLLSISGTRIGVSLHPFFEALVMIIILEILQEAGLRLPKVVGQTVAIVGGLVIGQAAVQAGIIGPFMVIVTSVTAISSFSIPSYSLGLVTRILRLIFMLLASALGAFGISIGIIYLLGYMCSLKSFGVGFMEPFTPYRPKDWKDSIIRAPQIFLKNRLGYFNTKSSPKKGGS